MTEPTSKAISRVMQALARRKRTMTPAALKQRRNAAKKPRKKVARD